MLCAYEGKISTFVGESPVLAIGLYLIDIPVLQCNLRHYYFAPDLLAFNLTFSLEYTCSHYHT